MLRTDFKYNGHWLSDFQMKMYDTDADPVWVSRVVDRSAQTAYREIPIHFTTHYDDVLKHDFLIIRNPELYDSSDDLRLTDKDIHRLRSWLEYPRRPMELVTTEDDEEIDVCYFGLFTSVQPFVVHKQCFGLRLNFTCNAPYGFSPVTAKRYEVAAAQNGEATSLAGDFLNNSVQYADMLQPTITISPKEKNATFAPAETYAEAQFNIDNSTTGDSMLIYLPSGYARMELSCEHKSVIGVLNENGQDVRKALTLAQAGLTTTGWFFGDLTQVYHTDFLRLNPGDNCLTFTNSTPQDVVVEISTRYIIKGGGF